MIQVKLNGALVTSPSFALPAKNSTLVIVPSLSRASVVMVRFTGWLNVAPFEGETRTMVGGMFSTLLDPGVRPAANQFVGSFP